MNRQRFAFKVRRAHFVCNKLIHDERRRTFNQVIRLCAGVPQPLNLPGQALAQRRLLSGIIA